MNGDNSISKKGESSGSRGDGLRRVGVAQGRQMWVSSWLTECYISSLSLHVMFYLSCCLCATFYILAACVSLSYLSLYC